MTKAKKRIAILCVVINIILLTQVCFGSVSAFYEAVIGSEVENRDGGDGEELQAESVCTQEQLENTRCGHYHTADCYNCRKNGLYGCSYSDHGSRCEGGVKTPFYQCGG